MTTTTDTTAAVTPASDEQLARLLVERAGTAGTSRLGPDGLLQKLTKLVLETGLEAEMSEHLGHDKHDPMGRNRGNSHNGARAKTVLTEAGPVQVAVPRDRDGSFDQTRGGGSVERTQVESVPGEGLVVADGPPEVVALGAGLAGRGGNLYQPAASGVVEGQLGHWGTGECRGYRGQHRFEAVEQGRVAGDRGAVLVSDVLPVRAVWPDEVGALAADPVVGQDPAPGMVAGPVGGRERALTVYPSRAPKGPGRFGGVDGRRTGEPAHPKALQVTYLGVPHAGPRHRYVRLMLMAGRTVPAG
jgi:hypothetical protein